jgi:hypothetical protein
VTRPAALLAVLAAALGVAASAADARIPPKWKNCEAVNKRYPHGVGRLRAHDATDGEPVTNFKRSNTLFAEAMHYNRGLDRDHDNIAYEQL